MSGRTRALLARDYGPPESLTLEQVETPEPGRGQVRVSVRAAGVSFVDVLIASGRYQLKPPLPFTPGSEFAGEVQAVGEGVVDLQPGDRVCGGLLHGAFAEQVVAPARALTRIPDAMPFPEAAVFRVSHATALYALVQRGRLASGETVLVLGAAGAVGLAAVQVAKALGATVIASASSDVRRNLALASGADHAIDSSAADWRDQVKGLTDGRGVDVVVDPVGRAATELAFRALAWGGRHLVIGFAGGEIARLPTNLPLLKGADLVGVDIRQFGEREPDAAAANLRRLFELYAQRHLKPSIAKRLPLEDAVSAMRMVEANAVAGRVVLEMGGPASP